MLIRVETGDIPDDLAREVGRHGQVAVDTETSGLDWRRDSLHLCQLFTPATGPVLVRRSDAHPANLARLFEDPEIVKVFHHAPFDLRFLEAAWGVRASSVVCTKTASKLLDPANPAAAHSLGALLERHFGVTLDKGAVRVSDWGAETLSPEQLAYAAADVTHLLRLWQMQRQELQARGLEPVFDAVCSYLPIDAHLEVAGFPNPLVY